jgi:single-strand DNA-binding protein
VSKSLNKIMLIGNLGNDPELRSTAGGGRVATFSLATSRNWTGPNGERQEKTEWHRCVAWNGKGSGLADVVERYAKKGDRIYVEGRIEYRQWQDKEGQTRYTTEVNVRDILLLGGRSGGGSAAHTEEAPVGARAAQGGKNQAASTEEFEDFPGALEAEDDDLPF